MWRFFSIYFTISGQQMQLYLENWPICGRARDSAVLSNCTVGQVWGSKRFILLAATRLSSKLGSKFVL